MEGECLCQPGEEVGAGTQVKTDADVRDSQQVWPMSCGGLKLERAMLKFFPFLLGKGLHGYQGLLPAAIACAANGPTVFAVGVGCWTFGLETPPETRQVVCMEDECPLCDGRGDRSVFGFRLLRRPLSR